MTIRHDMVVSRCSSDVSRLYVEARVAGLEVSHYPALSCHTYDGLPLPGTCLGVFRGIGALIYHKDEQRWEVRAFSDAGPVDLATLISTGLRVISEHGRRPGQWTRNRVFRHLAVSERTGKRLALADVCYRLEADDLLESAQAEGLVSLADAAMLELLSRGI